MTALTIITVWITVAYVIGSTLGKFIKGGGQ